MKACFALLYYLMTWLRPVRMGVWIGAAALLVALAVGLVFGLNLTAFGIAIYAAPGRCYWSAARPTRRWRRR